MEKKQVINVLQQLVPSSNPIPSDFVQPRIKILKQYTIYSGIRPKKAAKLHAQAAGNNKSLSV